jgi:protein arginine kinase
MTRPTGGDRLSFPEIARCDISWLDGSGPAAEIVISSRVRLARNLHGHRFTHHAAAAELRTILQEVVTKVASRPVFLDGWQLEMDACTPRQRKCLLEKHLISPFLVRDHKQSGVVISSNLSRVVMINEEDHLRIQVFESGHNPVSTCQAALALDSQIEEVIDFAFHEDFGYLTACPTNVGTGFRISILIHLPGLVMTNEIEKVLNSLRQLQFTVRGLYGEGSAVRGALFQISNLSTLGSSEEELTNDFTRHVSKVVQYEKLARERLLDQDPVGIRDMVYRSLGILRSAHLITAQEAFDRLSHVRMGVSLGLVEPIAMVLLNNALVRMQSAHIQIKEGRSIKGRERSAARADYLRRLLS